MDEGRRKRYLIAASVAVPVILIALYGAAQSATYKNFQSWNFQSYQENTSLNAFISMDTGGQQGKGAWIIKSDDTAASKPNVLARISSDETRSGYHILVTSEGSYSNFEASVKFKIISGKQAQAAGLIVRFQGLNRYFVLRADALNNVFSLCRAQVEGLICTQDRDVNITKGQWHSITAEVASQGIGGYLDGTRLLLGNDLNYISGGQIGLWTKGDSNVYFDDLKVNY